MFAESDLIKIEILQTKLDVNYISITILHNSTDLLFEVAYIWNKS